jgi:uncharacterized integral membrane protein
MHMAKILGAMAVIVTFLAFALSNTEHVRLSFVLGPPVEIRLIFLVLVAFASGAGAALFHRMVSDTRRRNELRRFRHRLLKSNNERRRDE